MFDSLYSKRGDMLLTNGISIDELACKYGTPLYIYSENIVSERLKLLKDNFKDFDIFYSFKSNPNPHICRFIKHSGHCADTASVGEVNLAAACGFGSDEIIFSSPGKREKDIEAVIGRCIIIADSLNELKMIDDICSRKGIKENIGIRINPDYSIEGNAALEVMSGFPSKFGIDQEALRENIEAVKALKNININGIQIYMGSQIVDHNIIYNNFLNIFRVALYCVEKLGLNLAFVDFGGGFGIQYTEKDEALNIQRAGEMVEKLKNSGEFSKISGIRLIIESGRFICGPSGIYAARVLDTKKSRGKNYAIIEGGMNTFFRPVFIKENRYPIIAANKLEHEKKEKVTLGGVMCTPIDIFEEDVLLPTLEKGDIIAFLNAGAYGYTMSLTKFISHEEVKEIYITEEKKILL